MVSPTITIDTREFDKTMKEYLRYSSRTNAEACDQHAYYVARNAVGMTHAATKPEVEASLNAPSKSYPSVPIAAIIVNTQLGKNGKKGLNGPAMARAVEKLIRIRQGHTNFLRAGWIPAIKRLAGLVAKKGGATIPAGTDKKGRNYGGATPSRKSLLDWKPFTIIWNSASKGDTKTLKMLEQGAQKALDKETQSMVQYIEKKQIDGIKKFWN